MLLSSAQPKQISKLTGWLLFFMMTCAGTVFAQSSEPGYKGVDSFPPNVGDISYNAALDDSTFIVCNPKRVFQYYNTGSYYRQHKREIEHYFKSRYQPAVQNAAQTGFLTIRFIINCSGKTGRFRMVELDASYQPYIFDRVISSQLMKLTKELQGWQPAVYKDTIYDSYQYITFKLNKGAIECVLP
ncbi:hypothetical protein A3860_37205 [Niastella vici]|uniref:TonB C-terminal domain-containing protein n=1 Tax=Niastella vici TaxID=1703345 RepID=A0A1V9FMG9_9BACT|nr:hypothetical protein [Niastella vici]OQP59554.1 hypothetical protein A3860_37205 [Niastella vici]